MHDNPYSDIPLYFPANLDWISDRIRANTYAIEFILGTVSPNSERRIENYILESLTQIRV